MNQQPVTFWSQWQQLMASERQPTPTTLHIMAIWWLGRLARPMGLVDDESFADRS